MIMKKTQLIKIATAILTLTLAVPMVTFASEGGPGFSTTPPSVEKGPGYSEPQPEAPPVPQDNPNNYYNQGIADPIVKEIDKYSYDQMSADIQSLSSRYGSHMQVRSIGRTPDNREIYDVIVGNPNASKHLMIQAGIHGREYITSLLVMKQLEYALAFYENGTYNDRSMSSMFDQVAVHFLPMTNPDGISISQWGEGGIGSEELKQVVRDCYQMDLSEGRTTASYEQYLTVWKSNARGVDLNHNFDASWESLNPTLNHVSGTDYKGPHPLSEPEAAALAALIDQYPFRTVLNYHSMGQVLYWDTANNKQHDSSLQLAQLFSGFTGYQILNSLGRGGTKDWVQTKQNAVPSLTIEVGRSRAPVPISEFATIWEQNKSGVAKAMEFTINR